MLDYTVADNRWNEELEELIALENYWSREYTQHGDGLAAEELLDAMRHRSRLLASIDDTLYTRTMSPACTPQAILSEADETL